ncbi:MAG: hypothetical protein OFPI_11810 [Osedax symbiont Rs2]|nr:MAG: hypothetical protein OFPI_11810 [Osedax symbiont Rs2]
MQHQQGVLRIADWLRADSARMSALRQAAKLQLPHWCIGAGFVRNLVWDKLHGYSRATPCNDIDLIYYDAQYCSVERDRDFERQLLLHSDFPWSVKNQARMHQRNGDAPYSCSADAMSYWPEIETAVAATLDKRGGIEIIAPFGIANLFACKITINPKRPKPEVFARRIADKQWLRQWPNLQVALVG